MSSLKKNSESKELKLSILERTLYKRLYTTLEKSLKASYEIYCDLYKTIFDDTTFMYSFDDFCLIVDKKLKGE